MTKNDGLMFYVVENIAKTQSVISTTSLRNVAKDDRGDEWKTPAARAERSI